MSQKNPFILHRKETFLNPSDPFYLQFQKLTEEEEQHGLYKEAVLSKIGRRHFWDSLLREKGLLIKDHSLVIMTNQAQTNGVTELNIEPIVQLTLFDDTPEPPEMVASNAAASTTDQVLKRSSITAMTRKQPSTPALIAVNDNLIDGPIFDWGCGRGRDILFFREQGYEAEGWDPAHKIDTPPESYPEGHFRWVQNAYVLNTITDSAVREDIIRKIFYFLPQGGHLYIAVRSTTEIKQHARSRKWRSFHDGWLTGSGSFQKGFSPPELIELLQKCDFQQVKVIREQPVIVLATKL